MSVVYIAFWGGTRGGEIQVEIDSSSTKQL